MHSLLNIGIQYTYSPYEVLIGDNKNFDNLVKENNKQINSVKSSYLRRIKYDQIKAENSVRNVQPKSRRCLFIDEPKDTDLFAVRKFDKSFRQGSNNLFSIRTELHHESLQNGLSYPKCNQKMSLHSLLLQDNLESTNMQRLRHDLSR